MTEPIWICRNLPSELWWRGGPVGPFDSGARWIRESDLYVYPGEIGVRARADGPFALRFGRVMPPLPEYVIRHRAGSIDVNHCLVPPWLNTAILIRDGDMRAVVRVPMWFRPKLKRALRQAGIELRWNRQVLMTLDADPLPPRRSPKAG